MMLVNLLDHYSIIEISGEDHLDFLQGQLTNDVKKNENKFIYSGMCNPKGRLYAFLRILRVPDLNLTFLVIPSPLADAVQKRLTMFILRSKVMIQKAENFHLLGVIEDSALFKIPADQKLNLPDQTNRSVIILNDLNLFNQITSEHSFDDISMWIKKDIELSLRKLKQNGIIQFNDYCSYSPLEQIPYGVKSAVNELINKLDLKVLGLTLTPLGYDDIAIKFM